MSIEQIEEKSVCFQCVGDPFLRSTIQETGIQMNCSYCGESSPAMPMGEFANHVGKAIKDHYRSTGPEPEGWQWRILSDPESPYQWQRDGDSVPDVIQFEAKVSEIIANDAQQILEYEHTNFDDPEESAFGTDIQYERVRDYGDDCIFHWSDLEEDLRTKNRYFNNKLFAFFQKMFADLAEIKTKTGRPLLRLCGPGTDLTELYRARFFLSNQLLEEALKDPVKGLGPPPTDKATAGRASAQGVSVFYGAVSPEIALAEVRPPVGSKVAIAKFVIQKQVVLLDLAALQLIEVNGSIFDIQLLARHEQAVFLNYFCNYFAHPVLPGEESHEYLITQVAADYLAQYQQPQIDGIIYSSTQTGKHESNVVFFPTASKTDPQNPTQFNVQLSSCDDGFSYPDYQISPQESSIESFCIPKYADEQILCLDEASITVCQIRNVSFGFKVFDVRLNQKAAQVMNDSL